SCLQRLADLPPSQLPAEQLVLVLQTLPDSCALSTRSGRTGAKLRECFQQLPFAAVQQWAGSDELTVDTYALGRLPALAWFDIPGAPTVVVAQAASCGCTVGLLDKALPAWSAAPRKQLDPDELLLRSTIRWDVPRQQLVDLLASKDLMAKVCSETVYAAGAGWRVNLNLVKDTKDEPGFTLGCWGKVVTYADKIF
ncbi:hypothetical protein HaLaN_27885, partial [Haematococcus lacustris]